MRKLIGMVLVGVVAASGGPALASDRDLAKSEREYKEAQQELRRQQHELRQRQQELSDKRFERRGPTPFWVSAGWNQASVDDSAKDCYGEQLAFSFGSALMLRAEYARATYEERDGTDSCDGVYWGDSDIEERALLGGLLLGRSGIFLVGGPSAVKVSPSFATDVGRDTGMRFELGWTSRMHYNVPVGFELLYFRNRNDILDYHGVALNMTFGARR